MEPVRRGHRRRRVHVLGLHTMEACLALAAAPDSRRVAVLECSVGRARFVACDGDAPVQVRRFMVGSGDVHSSALVAQLAIELPRTLEWLRESGLPAPSSVLYGNRLGIDEDGQAALRGEMERFEPAPLDARFAPDAVVPGLATLALLRRFAHGGAPTSLLEEPQLRVPWSRRKVGSFAALALVGAAMAWFGVGQGRGWLQARREHEVIATRAHEVEVRLAAASGLAAPGGETSVSADQLTRALGTRRPISRLIAEVSNAAGDEIGLDSLQFGGGDRVVVAGVVEAQSRSGALAALSAFTGKLRELAYVVADGQDEVTEVGGMPNVLRFKLGMAWRRS
ncbi:MAG: hypothetical protein U1E73_13050 [Planctomycetota bacterium]